MENEHILSEVVPERTENERPAPDSFPDRQVSTDSLPIGYFTVSGKQRTVAVNPVFASLFEGEGGFPEPLSETEFWRFVERSTADPGTVHNMIEDARSRILEKPILELQLYSSRAPLSLYLFPITASGSGDYAGLAIEASSFQKSSLTRSEMMGELSLQARKTSASIQGKVAALEGNLDFWSKKVAADMLQEVLSQQRFLDDTLDLALNLSQVFEGLKVYYQRIDLAELIAQIIAEEQDLDIHLVLPTVEESLLPMVQLDPALMRMATRNLLLGIQQKSLPGKIEVSLSSGDQEWILRIDSPRTLSFPGMIPVSQETSDDHPDIRLYVAERIIHAQGGSLQLEKTNAEEGTVSNAVITFPKEKPVERIPRARLPVEGPDQDVGRVLLALAHPDQQIHLRDALQDSGFRVDLALDGGTALDLAQRNNPDLIILSRSLPGLDGLLVTQGIRRWSVIPIILISDRTNLDDLVYAYQLGVDEYLRNPVSREELLAKVRVFIRRSASARNPISPEIYQSNQLKIDYSSRQVWVRGYLAELTPIEYNLLVYLSRHTNQIVPYDQMLENVWEGPEKGTRQGLFVHIKRIREKIESDPKDPQIISNKWGVGYVFNP